MSTGHRPSTIEIYQTDLERHLFAPAPRRVAGPSLELVSDWLRDWLVSGWMRWKQLAQAVNL